MGTLLLLVERAGETVFKEELFALVWNGATVEENNLTQSISTLRKVLGEKRGENRYIVTDSGRGYRFVAEVTRVLEGTTTAPPEIVTGAGGHSHQPPADFSFRNCTVIYSTQRVVLDETSFHSPAFPPVRRRSADSRFVQSPYGQKTKEAFV